MRKLGADALAVGALAAVSAATAGGAGCSTTKPTELVPGVLSQVVVPHDLQAVRVTVLANGRTAFDQGYDVGPTSTVQLPSTLGVVSGTSAETVVTITVRGYETSCEQSDDCTQLGSAPVGAGGARILRRSVQTYVDQHTLFVPMPLSYSCWNTDCGDEGMACKGNTCVPTTTQVESLVDFDPSLVDGTAECFSPRACFGDRPDGGMNAAVAPLVVDADACTYAFPAPAPLGVNVRAYFQNFGWEESASGQMQPVLKNGGEQEILNEDLIEGFTLVTGADAGTGGSQSLFRLAPGLCKLAQAARDPPLPPPMGAATYITLSDLRVANLCAPKPPLLPICAGERTNGPGLPSGETTSDQTCNVGVTLAPTASALYVVMDHSAVMHGAFGPMGSATTLSLSLSDPVFERTFAAFTFLPGQPSECLGATTSFTAPEIDFGLAAAVQGKIASKLDGWTATDTVSAPSPLDLQAAMRLDAGAYAQVIDFLKGKGKEPPNIAAVMFFVNRAPDVTNDCNPPLGGQASVEQAIETEILAAFEHTPSLQTYFVVLDDDAHDAASPTGALTFFDKVRADLPQAVQVLDATQTSSMQAAETAAANFSKLVTQLGTCVYDYELPAGADPSHLEVQFTAPGQSGTVVPSARACTAATQTSVDGWNFDDGRLRICGNSCSNLRQAILASAAVALKNDQPAQSIPVSATVLCSGTGPANDASAPAAGSGENEAGFSGESGDGGGVSGSSGAENDSSASTGSSGSASGGAEGGSGGSGGSSGASSGSGLPVPDAAFQIPDATALP